MNLRESFSLPFSRGELWYSCLDNIGNDFELGIQKILYEEKNICRPSSSAFIIYHLYNTKINDKLAQVIMDSIIRSSDYIQKIAFVGVSFRGKYKMKRYLNKSRLKLQVAYKYFDDMELAKDWLAGLS
jgi:hypothetical protein